LSQWFHHSRSERLHTVKHNNTQSVHSATVKRKHHCERLQRLQLCKVTPQHDSTHGRSVWDCYMDPGSVSVHCCTDCRRWAELRLGWCCRQGDERQTLVDSAVGTCSQDLMMMMIILCDQLWATDLELEPGDFPFLRWSLCEIHDFLQVVFTLIRLHLRQKQVTVL